MPVVQGQQRLEDPLGSLTTSLAKSMHFTFSERPSLKK